MSMERGTGAGGLPVIRLTHGSGSRAEVYEHGAHVTSWVPAEGDEVLFLSRAAEFAPGVSIRGGIPVIFPQFASMGPLEKHGFARTRRWSWLGAGEEDGGVRGALWLRDDERSRALWPHAFEAELALTLGARSLAVRLSVRNPGPEPLRFTAALHTYLRVGELAQTELRGLGGVRYRDAAEDNRRGVEAEVLRFDGEIDRVYHGVDRPLLLRDPRLGRILRVEQAGFTDAVVWNPGPTAARELPDLEAAEQREMLCVEAAQVEVPVEVAGGAEWWGEQVLGVE